MQIFCISTQKSKMGAFMCDKKSNIKNHKPISDVKDRFGNTIYSSSTPLKIIIENKYHLKKNISPENALWQAVLIQALEDASIISTKSRKRKSYKKNAINWLKNEGSEREELQQVCSFAGVRYQKFIKILQNSDL
ncbi:MAG: hypothetical protein SFT90_05545 [Rickettsiales bacterium]|nr:hypothetical protein [Rickettsiales bacterium]